MVGPYPSARVRDRSEGVIVMTLLALLFAALTFFVVALALGG